MEHKELAVEIDVIIVEELIHARSKFLNMNSGHEGYAVILEETEELQTEMVLLKAKMDMLWNTVKGNDADGQSDAIRGLKKDIRSVIKEAIQVAAMCQRYQEDVLGEV